MISALLNFRLTDEQFYAFICKNCNLFRFSGTVFGRHTFISDRLDYFYGNRLVSLTAASDQCTAKKTDTVVESVCLQHFVASRKNARRGDNSCEYLYSCVGFAWIISLYAIVYGLVKFCSDIGWPGSVLFCCITKVKDCFCCMLSCLPSKFVEEWICWVEAVFDKAIGFFLPGIMSFLHFGLEQVCSLSIKWWLEMLKDLIEKKICANSGQPFYAFMHWFLYRLFPFGSIKWM